MDFPTIRLSATALLPAVPGGAADAVNFPGWRTIRDAAGCTVTVATTPPTSLRRSLAGDMVIVLPAKDAPAPVGESVRLVFHGLARGKYIEFGRQDGTVVARDPPLCARP